MKGSLVHVRGSNRLLALMPQKERARLTAMMETRWFEHRDSVYEIDKPITHVYFPLHGLISLVVVMQDGWVSEVGTIGNEGMAGLPLVLGANKSPTRAFFQVPGEAMRMKVSDFKAEIARDGLLVNLVRRYAQAFFMQVAQSTACNQLHPVEQRFCRWILMTHDRVGTPVLELTQEFIAAMLGVRRASVSIAAGVIQKAGHIRYNRGVVTVLDREGLEACACECYAVVRKEFERLLG